MSELSWMAAAFRRNGLRVKEVAGWKNRGRPGTFAPRGVMFHHTASNRRGGVCPALGICVEGRSDVSGPLCNVLVGRDGTVFVVASGRANHAGTGGPWRSVPRDSGNAYTIGVEVENDGIGEPWSPALLQTCDVVFATLLVGLRRTSSWLCAHKEWAPGRKSDPARINMDAYRARVRAEIRTLGRGAPKPPADGTYTVQPGDTLWRIARNHRLSVAELLRLNPGVTELIRVGQILRVKK